MNSDLIPLIGLGIVLVFVSIEAVWSRRSGANVFSTKETLSSYGITALNRLGGIVTLAWKSAAVTLASGFAPWSIPVNIYTIIASFLLVEIAYYWYHRLSHEVGFLWAIHHVHHSSPEYNLTTALRLNVLGNLVGIILVVPLALLGLNPTVIIASIAIGLFFQFFLHTQSIPTLGRIEGWINTPSAHRVHHGSNEQYIDKNYSAIFAFLDRVFGTYEPEVETVVYGVTTGHYGYNPFTLCFKPMSQWAARKGWVREQTLLDQLETYDVSPDHGPSDISENCPSDATESLAQRMSEAQTKNLLQPTSVTYADLAKFVSTT